MARKVSFFEYRDYNLAAKYILEQGLDCTFIMQPHMTVRTLELGSRYSPDFVCTPFKTILGSMIEALESGADTLVTTMGGCRLGYYGELQGQILKDLGYEFDLVNFAEFTTGRKRDYVKPVRMLNPKFSMARLTRVATETVRMIEYLDLVESIYYKNCGFELTKGTYHKAYDRFSIAMEIATTGQEIDMAYKVFLKQTKEIPLEKPVAPLRVGIIGEIYTALDPFSNLEVQQKLADMGVEVHRFINVTNRMFRYQGKNLAIGISEYCKFDMGPTSTINIWSAKNYASKGFDGIIHIKSSGCTPETDIMPVLQNISHDYKVPILYLTYDSQTSDTGLNTRLEAFYDMISMRKKAII